MYVDLNEFYQKEKIGEGQYGKVYLVQHKKTSEFYAAKILNIQNDSQSKEDIISLSHEVNNNAGMNHPSVIKFIGYSPTNFNQDPQPVIISEYCENGSLLSLIQNHDQYTEIWDETKKLITIFGIASGMKYLHDHEIIHRDLKIDNILMDSYMFPKIADFGLSKRNHFNTYSMTLESAKDIKGTPLYTSPEVFETRECTKASDVYSFSIVMYEILTDTRPFKNLDLFQLYRKVTSGERPSFEDVKNVENVYCDLIERCWSQNPKDRPTFNEIVEELKTSKFITEKVVKEEFQNYVNLIENYQSTFNTFKIIKIDKTLNSIDNKFRKLDIERYKEEKQKNVMSSFLKIFGVNKEKLYPIDEFNKLNEECQHLVVEAENDEVKQYYIASCLIENKNNFPLNVDLGIKYLERSISGGNVESALYFSQMLIKGNVIQQDLKKAKKYLSMFLKKSVSVYFLYGKILLKENKVKQARKIFEEGSEKGDENCMYKYTKMLIFEGNGENFEKAKYNLNLLSNKCFKKSELYLRIIDYLSNLQSFNDLSPNIQMFMIKQLMTTNKDNLKHKTEFVKEMKISIKDYNGDEFCIEKLSKSIELIKFLQELDLVTIEVIFPSAMYENNINILLEIRKKYKVNVCIYVLVYDMTDFSKFDKRMINCIKIESDVKMIKKHLFEMCTSLEQIIIPSSVTSIEDGAFQGCKSLTQVIIPSSVELIGEYAFSQCTSLKQITIPSSVESIENSAFEGCSSLIQITIPSSVSIIRKKVFYECSSLTQIIIPSSINSIGDRAFQGCKSLTQISLPSSLKTIGEYVFSQCSLLEQITIPSSLNSINEYAFSRCSLLKKVIIPSSVKSIRKSAFRGCCSLVEIEIPSSVTFIDDEAFNECSSLTQITIPKSAKLIGYGAFIKCASLEQITILSTPKVIKYWTFFNCSSLKQITIPSSVTSIESSAFGACESLKQIIIPSSVKSLSSYAFSNCTSLEQISIPSSIKSIESSTFFNCASLKQISIPSSIESIGTEAFEKCSSLIQVIFEMPSSLKSIGKKAFEGCSSLSQISIPSSLKTFYQSAFEGCSSLSQISIPSSAIISDPDYNSNIEIIRF